MTIKLAFVATDCCDGPFGSRLKSSHYTDSGASVVRLGNIGIGMWRESDAFISLEYANELHRHAVVDGDLVLAGLGDSGNPVGRAVLVPPGIAPAIVKADCFRFRLDTAKVDPRYVVYAINSDSGRHQSEILSEGATRKRLTLTKARSLKIHNRPLAEQRCIADFLDTETTRIDSLVGEYEHQIGLVEEEQEVEIRTQMLTGIDPMSFEVPSADLGAGVRSFGQTLTLQRGHDLPTQDRVDGEFSIISSGGVSGSHERPSSPGPGVVTGRYGTIGEVFFSEGPYWALNTTLYVSDFRGNSERWCYYLLRALPLDFDKSKSAVTGINRNVLKPLRVPVPSRVEQEAIVVALDTLCVRIEILISELRSQIDHLTEYRQALITKAVTGSVDACQVTV